MSIGAKKLYKVHGWARKRSLEMVMKISTNYIMGKAE